MEPQPAEQDRQADAAELHLSKLARRFEGKYARSTTCRTGSDETEAQCEFEAFGPGTEETMMSRELYLEGIGSIGWPAVMTRPEIAYTFGVLSQFSMYPLTVHYQAIMHTVGYLVNTAEMGLTFGGKLQIPMGLSAFPKDFHKNSGLWSSSDSSWGRKPRPFAGHTVMRTNASMLWAANKLKVVAMATAEAETAEGSRAVKDIIYVKHVCVGIRRPAIGPGLLTVDNSAMFELCQKETVSSRTRYFERATAFVKWAVLKLLVTLYLVGTDDCLADIFTKAVDKDTFLKMRAALHNSAADDGMDALYGRARKAAKIFSDLLGRIGGI